MEQQMKPRCTMGIKDVMEMFGVSRTTVREWIKAGKLIAFKVNDSRQARVFILSSSVHALMSRRTK